MQGAQPLKILLVEDNIAEAELFKELLSDFPQFQIHLTHLEYLEAACQYLAQEAVDLILLDLCLPDSQGLETVQSLQKWINSHPIPIVVLTGLLDEEMAIKAIQLGVQDYLLKSEINSQNLIRTLRYALERTALEIQLRQATHQLENRVRERTLELEKTNEKLRQEIENSQKLNVAKERAEAIFNDFFNLSLDLFCIAGVDGYFKRVNPRFQIVLGYSEAELLHYQFFDFVHPDDQEATWEATHALAQGRCINQFENRYRCRDGSYRWLSWTSIPHEGGLIYATARDVTEMKKRSEALQKVAVKSFTSSKSFFNSIVNFLCEVLDVEYALISEVISHHQARTVAVCSHGEIIDNFEYDLTGTPCAYVLDKHLCIYPDSVQELFPDDLLLQQMEAESYVGTPLVDGAGEILGLIAILGCQPLRRQDFVAEMLQIFANRVCAELSRQRSEVILRQSEEQFRQLAENIREVFYIRDLEQNQMLYMSPTFEQMWGMSCQSVYENPDAWMDAVDPEDRENLLEFNPNHAQDTFCQEFRIVRAQGEVRWIRKRSFPVVDSHGKIYRIAGIAEDITEQKEAEIALQALNNHLEIRVQERTSELQASEAALRESQNFVKRITDSVPGIVYLYDYITQQNIYCNHQIFEILGYTVTEIQQQNMTQSFLPLLTHPEEKIKWLHHFRDFDSLQDDQTLELEYRIRDKMGNWHWFVSREVIFSRTPEGKPQQILGIGTDITHRKEMENALEKQLRRALLLKEITAEIRQTLDTQNVFQATVTKIGEAFKVNRCLLQVYHEDSSLAMPCVAQYVAKESELVLGTAIPIGENSPLHRILATDLALAYNQIQTDVEWRHLSGLCRRLNLKSILAVRTSYLGKTNGVITLHQCDRNRSWTEDEQELLEAVASQVGIALAQAKLLEQKQQQQEALARNNAALQKATAEAQAANLAKTEFLATMSHEIRTPMNAILGFCELLKHTVEGDRNLFYVQSILESGKILMSLINDILDLSKIESGKLELHNEVVNLQGLITEIQRIFSHKAHEKNLILSTQMALDLPTAINIDAVRLRQILFNVVGNALKFTETGEIKIMVESDVESSSPGTVCLQISISDTGIGIAPEQQERIFEAFTQSDSKTTKKYGGTGLGLAITKRLTEMIGGYIEVESELGLGSTFRFIFPQIEISGNPISSALNQFPVVAELEEILPEGVPAPLEPTLVVVDWSELLEKLTQLQVTSWEMVSRTMKTRDLRQFSHEIQELALTYPCTLLQEYSKKLATQIEMFDWENLPDTLGGFPDLVQRLSCEV